MTTHYAFGIGARRGVEAQHIIDIVTRVGENAGVAPRGHRLCSAESKSDEQGILDAARELGMVTVFLPLAALRARGGAAATHSPRVKAMFGVGSVAETAALVGAGAGSRLVARRLATPYAACALAIEEPVP